MAALNNATGQNVANQAALMASQRGAGSNAGLLARQAAMQGANLQQQAAGQGAALQANQSLNALNQLGGLANQQVAQQGQAVGNLNQFAQGNQQNVYNALGQQNNANVSNASQMNSANASIAAGNQKGQQGILGGLLGGVGSVLSGGGIGGALGKVAQNLASGGEVQPKLKSNAPRSAFGMHIHGLAQGGQVPVMLSPGEKVLSPQEAAQVAEGAKSPMQAKVVPGKAKVKGDNEVNDTFHTKLEEGSIVIPRTKAGNEKDAAAFVRAHYSSLSKKSKK